MKYDPPLQQATLIKRYKRFLADVRATDGSEFTIHCPNTGSMRHCAQPGGRVWYSDSGNPKRKYPCTWELAEISLEQFEPSIEGVVGVNTGKANSLVQEAIENGTVTELAGYDEIRTEVHYGQEKSRIDLLLSGDSKADCYVEVKSVTLVEEGGLGLFPDAVSLRGQKHLRELMQMVAEGKRAVLFFCVQHSAINKVAPADNVDPEYGRILREAVTAGVEVFAYRAEISPEAIQLKEPLTVCL